MDSKDKEIAQLTEMIDNVRRVAVRAAGSKDLEIAALREVIAGLERMALAMHCNCAISQCVCVRCWIVGNIAQGLLDVGDAIMNECREMDAVDRMRSMPDKGLGKVVGKTILRIAKKRE